MRGPSLNARLLQRERLVERFYVVFEAVYEERHQERYGFWCAPGNTQGSV